MIQDVVQLMVIHGPFDATWALHVNCVEWIRYHYVSTCNIHILR